MDDPWGSPWNTTTAPRTERSPSPSKSTKSARSDLELPPRAFLSTTNSPRLRASSIQSAWADDNDGFGDWSAGEPVTATGTSPSASGWGGGWAADVTPQKHHLTATPKDDGFGFGSPSPIAWPGNTVVSSGTHKHGSSSPFRPHGFDPWASDLEEHRSGLDAPRLVIDQPPTSTQTGESAQEQSVEERESPWNDNVGLGFFPAETVSPVVDDGSQDKTEVADTVANEPMPMEDNGPELAETKKDPKFQSTISRSSSVSNDSDQEIDRQDSPITSIDDDARSRGGQLPRKVSGKIQVLVQKFDGLAKAAVDDPAAVRRERSVTPHAAAVRGQETPSDPVPDLGASEHAEDEEEQRPVTPAPAAGFSSSETTPERASTPQPRIHDSPVERPSPLESRSSRSPVSARGRSSTVDTMDSEVQRVASQYSDVTFSVDAALADKLFQDVNFDELDSRDYADHDVPDYPITDSFTDMSERKVWYRISRLGSSRRHDSADWDSYRRIDWPTSTLHTETLQIVRRWVEQDSLIGRTTLGGGSTKTDLFGWDSVAEPVALDTVFAKRRRSTHIRPIQQPLQMPPTVMPETSLQSPRRPGGDVQEVKPRPISLVGPPVAGFGWSSSPVEPRPIGATRSSESKEPGRTSSTTPRAPPVPLSLTEQDDDDDWGEMVSSPTTAPKISALGSAFFQPPPQAIPPTHTDHLSEDKFQAVPATIQPAQPMAVPDRQLSSDPWASNDLSIFESTTEPTTTIPIAPDNKLSFTPMAPAAIISPVAVPHMPTNPTTSVPAQEEDPAETEAVVRRIVRSLPDLSYMLR